MTKKTLLKLLFLGLGTLITRSKKPVLGTIIITDYCNLHCKHCAVNNINKVMYSYSSIISEMERFYNEGIRILFISGGETLLWQDGDKTLYDLVKVARDTGFLLINIVTNGTINLDIPEVDLIFLSLDGTKEVHNSIRGENFDLIESNLSKVTRKNISLFMAINKLNYREIIPLAKYARDNPAINGISFNFHTPYRTTEELCLSEDDKAGAVKDIKTLIDKRFPVFNLKTTLDQFMKNSWKRPCPYCIVSENGERFVCGRCSKIPGLCDNCGYLFAMEFTGIFSGNLRVITDMLRTYPRFV